MNITEATEKISSKQDLEHDEIKSVMSSIMSGECTEIEIISFLMSLKTKGESIVEISGAAEILITAHYHHPRLLKQGKRTWFQCPSIDSSKDFTARTGMWNEPGVLTFTIDKNGWSNYKIV